MGVFSPLLAIGALYSRLFRHAWGTLLAVDFHGVFREILILCLDAPVNAVQFLRSIPSNLWWFWNTPGSLNVLQIHLKLAIIQTVHRARLRSIGFSLLGLAVVTVVILLYARASPVPRAVAPLEKRLEESDSAAIAAAVVTAAAISSSTLEFATQKVFLFQIVEPQILTFL